MGRWIRVLAGVLAWALVAALVQMGPVGAATARPAGSSGAATVAAAAATAAAAAAVPTVTRVDSSVQVTPDSLGRVTIPYCPASDPCAFAAPPANTVVTGRAPTGGGPPIPAKLLAYNPTTTGFTLRAMDTAGALITTAIQVWYHAASTLTQNEEVRTVTVTTDANGYATVGYATPRGVAATAVIASGVSPNGGPGNWPANLMVPSRTATGFTVRALSQSGTLVANTQITLSYYAAWAGRIDPGTQWVAANATTTVTTDANGFANVSFAQALPAPPTGIVASPVAPSGGVPVFAASLIPHNPTATGFRVRVFSQSNTVVASQSVTLSYHAVAAVPDPVDKRSMTPGDSADVGTATPTLHGVFTRRPATSGHVDYEVANPATGAVVAPARVRRWPAARTLRGRCPRAGWRRARPTGGARAATTAPLRGRGRRTSTSTPSRRRCLGRSGGSASRGGP